MAWLVDGFNLLHAVVEWQQRLEQRGPAAVTRELARALARWSMLLPRGQRVLLVLDGGPGNLDPVPGSPGLTVKFRAHADTQILEELRRDDQRHTLVSRDRELVVAARKGGLHDAIDPGVFWARVRDDLDANQEEVERQRTPDKDEVAAWAALFRGVTPPAKPATKTTRAEKVPPAAKPAATPPAAPPPHGLPPPLSPDEVKEWLDFFGKPRSS